MALTLIIGPMKSGKSLELIARVAPHEFAKKKVLYLQPKQNIRDDGVSSRLGVNVRALRVDSLKGVDNDYDVIGIDEAHMLPAEDIAYISKWLNDDKELVVAGLDLDYRGKLTPMMLQLFQLKPDKIISKLAVCEVCHQYNAQFTQIIHDDKSITGGLPVVVPEDGTYTYQARCRRCYETP